MLTEVEVLIEAVIAFIMAVTKLPEFDALIKAIDALIGQTPPPQTGSASTPPFTEGASVGQAPQANSSAQTPAQPGQPRRV